MQRLVKINELGLRVGEDHPNAKLTDREVDKIRELHEEGYGYRRLAAMFNIGKRTVRDIVSCKRRAQVVVDMRVVRVADE